MREKSGRPVRPLSHAPALLGGADWSAADTAIFPRLLVPSEHIRKMILISNRLSLPTLLSFHPALSCVSRITCID